MIPRTTCLIAVVLLAGCDRAETPRAPAGPANVPDTAASAPAPAAPVDTPQGATVLLQPTAGNRTHGTLQIMAEPSAIHVTGSVEGLQPDSEFGFHIHEKGDCSAPDGASAGDHFNPTSVEHGSPDTATHHAGDMLNLKADAAGTAKVDMMVTGLALRQGGTTDVLNRAVVVHAQPDDYKSQPAGNSGARVACGVISPATS